MMPRERTGSKEEVLFLSFIVLFWFVQYLLTPYLTIFLMSRGMTAFVAGVVAGAYGLVQILVRMPVGAMTDQMARPVLLIRAGCFIMIVSTLLMRFGEETETFFFARLIAGISAASWVVAMSLYVSLHVERSKTRSIGRSTVAQYTGILLAFLVAGAVRSSLGMEALLSLNMAAAVLCFFVSLLLGTGAKEGASRSAARTSLKRRMALTIRNRQLFRGSVLFFFSQFVIFSTALSFTANYAESRGVGNMWISVLAALFSISTLFSSALVDRGLDLLISDRTASVLSFALLCLSCVFMPLIRSVWLLCLMQLLSGFAYGIHCSVLNGFAIQTVEPDGQSAAIGYFQGLHCIAITTAPMTMGKLIDLAGGYKVPYWILASVCLLAAALTAWFFGAQQKEGRL